MAEKAMRRFRLLTLLFLLKASCVFAEQATIDADYMEHSGTIYNATGSVLFKRYDATVRADKARYDDSTTEMFAEGGVVYEDAGVMVNADSAFIDFGRQTGTIYNSVIYVKGDNYSIRGGEIEKTGKDRYFIRRASFTTCDAPLPFWRFSARDLDVLVGDRLEAKHATMRIKGIPVLYTPYLWAPILTERKTGFLLPVVGFRDSTGFYYRQPFFWALADDRDSTFYLDYYPERGFGEGAEYRYVARRVSGSLNLYHFGDREIDEDFYEVRTAHRLSGYGYLDVNYINHRDFYRLYEPYIETSSKRFVESKAEVYRPFGNSRLYLVGRYLVDLREDVEEDSVLQRLPEAGFFLAPFRAGPFLFSATTSATNFFRKTGPSGQRFDMGLKSAYTLGRGPYFSQTAGVAGSLYALDGDAPFTRGIFDYGAHLYGRHLRNYGGIGHAVESTLSYRYKTMGSDEPPLLDGLELASRASRLELSFLNRLAEGGAEFLTLRFAGGYDFLNEDRPFTPLSVDAYAGRPITLRASAGYDFYGGEIDSLASEAAMTVSAVTASVGQIFRRNDDVLLYSFGLGYGGRRVSAQTRLMYDPEADDEVRELSGSVGYIGQCWGIGVSAVKRPEDYSVFLAVSLTGLGSVEPLSHMTGFGTQ